MSGLNPRQARFVKGLQMGMSKGQSALMAGYSPESISSYPSQLLRKANITKALEAVGLSDTVIAKGIKQHIQDGMGVKSTADTSLRAIDLAARLKGHLDKEVPDTNLSQTNIYINELRGLSEEELAVKLKDITTHLEGLKALETTTGASDLENPLETPTTPSKGKDGT